MQIISTPPRRILPSVSVKDGKVAPVHTLRKVGDVSVDVLHFVSVGCVFILSNPHLERESVERIGGGSVA